LLCLSIYAATPQWLVLSSPLIPYWQRLAATAAFLALPSISVTLFISLRVGCWGEESKAPPFDWLSREGMGSMPFSLVLIIFFVAR